MKVLITGGAGFVGSSLALLFKRDDPSIEVTAFDNLKRRGSEVNLRRFKVNGIKFVHGDVRQRDDLMDLAGNFDLLIEASAEPSVLAGLAGTPNYVLTTNLMGTLNCLEFCRKRAGLFLFLSTSRVYSLAALRGIILSERSSRYEISPTQSQPGINIHGISEHFPVHSARSMYGASKLCSEFIIQEYVHSLGMHAIINRCGVICGSGQFGKLEQGVFALWVIAHYFKHPLKYKGFGGEGKQVRDLLHPDDLFLLIKKQISNFEHLNGECFNVGGGTNNSVSLRELTEVCREVIGQDVSISRDVNTSPVDVPVYITNFSKIKKAVDWQPKHSIRYIIEDIYQWLRRDEQNLRPLFEPGVDDPFKFRDAA